MSRQIVLLPLFLTAVSLSTQPFGPPRPNIGRKTPVEILNTQYEDRYGPRRNGRPCRLQKGEDIVVCGDASSSSSPYRLPLRDERGAPGDRVRHMSEPARASLADHFCHRPGCGEPSKLGETIGKIITALKGEDPR